MAKPTDRTGQRYGRLVCLSMKPERTKSGHVQWECICDCGNRSTVLGNNLSKGNTTSCGCMSSRLAHTHGKSSTRLYKVWAAMKHRCGNSDNPHFHNYGGKGISVCQEWMDYETFYQWSITSGYRKGLTIERADNSKNYCPDNCSWIPKGEQSNNTSRCVILSFDGLSMNMKQWSVLLGIPYCLIQSRIKNGWSVKESLTRRSGERKGGPRKIITIGEESLSIADWARKLKIPVGTLGSKIYQAKNKTVEQVISSCL